MVRQFVFDSRYHDILKLQMSWKIILVFHNSDYGYYRHVNTSECVRQNAANKTLELCLNGEEDELLTAG